MWPGSFSLRTLGLPVGFCIQVSLLVGSGDLREWKESLHRRQKQSATSLMPMLSFLTEIAYLLNKSTNEVIELRLNNNYF